MVAVIEKLKDLYPGTGKASGGRTGGQHDGTADHRAGGRYAGLWALYRKEMGDNIHSRRFLLILALVVLAGFASLYGALSNISSAASDGEFIFLKLFTTSGSSIPSFVSFIAILGPFVGLALGFDAINGERNSGTLNRLLSQPIYRDSVINGKFLAGAVTIFIMVLAMGGLVSAIGLLAIGIPPSLEEVGRILVFLLFTGVYICFWLGLSILFSVVCRHAATSALAVIACWLFFTIFMSGHHRCGPLSPGRISGPVQHRGQLQGDHVPEPDFALLSLRRGSDYDFKSRCAIHRPGDHLPVRGRSGGLSSLRAEPAPCVAPPCGHAGPDPGGVYHFLSQIYESGNPGQLTHNSNKASDGGWQEACRLNCRLKWAVFLQGKAALH